MGPILLLVGFCFWLLIAAEAQAITYIVWTDADKGKAA